MGTAWSGNHLPPREVELGGGLHRRYLRAKPGSHSYCDFSRCQSRTIRDKPRPSREIDWPALQYVSRDAVRISAMKRIRVAATCVACAVIVSLGTAEPPRQVRQPDYIY